MAADELRSSKSGARCGDERQIGTRKVRTAEIRTGEVDVLQVVTTQVYAGEIRMRSSEKAIAELPPRRKGPGWSPERHRTTRR